MDKIITALKYFQDQNGKIQKESAERERDKENEKGSGYFCGREDKELLGYWVVVWLKVVWAFL